MIIFISFVYLYLIFIFAYVLCQMNVILFFFCHFFFSFSISLTCLALSCPFYKNSSLLPLICITPFYTCCHSPFFPFSVTFFFFIFHTSPSFCSHSLSRLLLHFSPLLSSPLFHQHRYIYSNYGRDPVNASPPQGILKLDVLAGTESSWIGAADEFLGEPIFAKKKDAREYCMLN